AARARLGVDEAEVLGRAQRRTGSPEADGHAHDQPVLWHDAAARELRGHLATTQLLLNGRLRLYDQGSNDHGWGSGERQRRHWLHCGQIRALKRRRTYVTAGAW